MTPVVLSKTPGTNATAVRLDVSPTATFNTQMNATTITTATFTLTQSGNLVASVVTLAGTTATINPTANLTPNTVVTATITTGAKSSGGASLAAPYVWSFTTEASPTVLSTNPANAAVNVPLNVSPTATFSTAMNPTTINATTFTLKQGNTAIAAAVSYAGTTATINPTANLTAGLVYTATISTGATSVGGAAMATAFVWTFTAGSTVVAPVVVSTCPMNGAINVQITTRICAVFSKGMDSQTLTALTFTVNQGNNPVVGTVSYDAASLTAYFLPNLPLSLNLPYSATITTGAKDTSNTPLAANKVWSWNNAACSQLPITLKLEFPKV